MSAFFANLLGNYITGRLLGGKKGGNIAALSTFVPMISQGLGSDGFNFETLFGGDKKSDQISNAVGNIANVPTSGPKTDEVSKITSKVADSVLSKKDIDPVFTQADNTLGYSKFLVDLGILDPNSKIANLLNSRVGEALATGIGSEIFSKFDSNSGTGTTVSRPFGGEGNVRINIPNKYAAGGYIDGQYFPRRNGGIMPSEGSGQKDDVPAMLMAGEFVLTKDAVKGLGDGDSNRGIERAYSMMNKLENKADNYE